MMPGVIQCTNCAINRVRLLAVKFITAQAKGPTRSPEVAGMSSSQIFSARQVLACAGLTVLAALSGCSMFRSRSHADGAPPPPVAQSDSPAPEVAQTDTDALADAGEPVIDEPGTTTVLADAGPALKPTAPKSYVVQRGDTLWGISNMFLRDPWHWPEIWYVNPQIQNPHRIYPGDTVQLALVGNGRTALQVVRSTAGIGGPGASHLEPLLRSSPLDTPIETIPYAAVSAFMSRPAVLTREQIDSAAYIVALAESHDVAGTGHELLVKKLDADAGARYSVMHVDEPLIDPDNGQRLGYVAIYTGTAQITQPGKISKAVLTSSARETLQGDLLIPEEHTPTTDFVPHSPQRQVNGRIIDVIDNVLLAGQYQVVALNRGTNDGLERGNVLTVDQAAVVVVDNCASIGNASTCRIHHRVTLPTDTAGTLLIFRAYPRLSYALILGDTVPIQVGDHVRSP